MRMATLFGVSRGYLRQSSKESRRRTKTDNEHSKDNGYSDSKGGMCWSEWSVVLWTVVNWWLITAVEVGDQIVGSSAATEWTVARDSGTEENGSRGEVIVLMLVVIVVVLEMMMVGRWWCCKYVSEWVYSGTSKDSSLLVKSSLREWALSSVHLASWGSSGKTQSAAHHRLCVGVPACSSVAEEERKGQCSTLASHTLTQWVSLSTSTNAMPPYFGGRNEAPCTDACLWPTLAGSQRQLDELDS